MSSEEASASGYAACDRVLACWLLGFLQRVGTRGAGWPHRLRAMLRLASPAKRAGRKSGNNRARAFGSINRIFICAL